MHTFIASLPNFLTEQSLSENALMRRYGRQQARLVYSNLHQDPFWGDQPLRSICACACEFITVMDRHGYE